MSEQKRMFEGWVAIRYRDSFYLSPKDFWDYRGRMLEGNLGGDIPGFTSDGYRVTPKMDNRDPKGALLELGFEVRD